jgi:hypothetical protein
MNCLHSEGELVEAKQLVLQYKAGSEPPGTTKEQVRQ